MPVTSQTLASAADSYRQGLLLGCLAWRPLQGWRADGRWVTGEVGSVLLAGML